MQEFTDNTHEFLRQLQLKEEYKHLEISVNFDDTSSSKGLTIRDNACIMIDRSNAVARELAEFMRKEYERLNLNSRIKATITISQKDDANANIRQAKQEETEKKHQSNFVAEEPKYKLEDVILPEETRKSIDDAIASIKNFDLVYNQWNFKSKEPSAKTNLCFWGPPGTGKTMCAHAMADYLGKKILIASYADIQSEYVGVGPKNLKEVFRQAETNDAILFFDEADSFLRKRTSDTSNSASMHYNSMTNEMMKHLEDFNGVVIFATNLTENTDEAFKTRMSFSVEFKIPDEKCRALIIQKMIPQEVPLNEPFTDEDYTEMAKASDKLVGRDIRNAVKSTLSKGAQNHTYPFTKDMFIDGFKDYFANKNAFNNGMKKSAVNPMDIYTANGCIHNLLAYAAWLDGPETEKETEYLKIFSRILSRNKLIVTKLSDLPSLEEICQEIKEPSLKKKALIYLAFFMAVSEQDDKNIQFISEVAKKLEVDDSTENMIMDYHKAVKAQNEIKNNINNNK